MSFTSGPTRIALIVCSLAIVSSLAMVSTQSPAKAEPIGVLLSGVDRPSSVPNGYLVTPFGYFHPACVQQVRKGETLLADGRIRNKNGTTPEEVPVCGYPRYSRSGNVIGEEQPRSLKPEVDGWVENANVATGSLNESYGGLVATWTVPPQPTNQEGQVLFFFPGLEDISNTESILQPVLQWAGGQWSVANWNCCLNNIVTESTPVNVNPNDRILGSISNNCGPGQVVCATWNVLSMDLSTGANTTLSHTPSAGQVFNWAFGGVMEPYFVTSCDDYPPNHQLQFSVMLFTDKLRPIGDPIWTSGANLVVMPQCGYGVQTAPHIVTLDY